MSSRISSSTLTSSGSRRDSDSDSERKSSLELPEPLQIAIDNKIHQYSSAPTSTSLENTFSESQDVDLVNFAALYENASETSTEICARIRGIVPYWMDGNLLRNGPGMFELDSDHYSHYFDPLALIQKFRIQRGNIYYSAKFLRTETYLKNKAASSIICGEFGKSAKPDPSKTFFARHFCRLFSCPQSDNCPHNFLVHDNRVFVVGEKSKIIEIDPKSLEICSQKDLNAVIENFLAMSSHFVSDSKGNNYNLITTKRGYYFIKIPSISDATSEPTGNNERLTSLETILESKDLFDKVKLVASMAHSNSGYPAYIHSFGMSRNYFVIIEHPHRINNFTKMLQNITKKTFEECLEWQPKNIKMTYIHVLESNGNRIPIKFVSDPFFVFHHINTYEDGDLLIVDLLAYRDAAILHWLHIKELKEGIFPNFANRAQVWRFILPLKLKMDTLQDDENLLKSLNLKTRASAFHQKDGSIYCIPETLSEKCFEMPSINSEPKQGVKYRYCYGVEMPFDSSALMGSKVFKLDVEHRRTIEWRRDNIHQFAGEPIFVPKPHAIEEDDGVLIVPVTSVRVGEPSYLLFLNTITMQEMARAEFDFVLPASFHGIFVNQTH